MNEFDKGLFSSLAGMQPPTPYNDEELAILRQKAWQEQRMLIVSPYDGRLKNADQMTLLHIGETLYGRGASI